MVGLSIYGKEKKEPLNKFQTPAGFGEIAGELVERAIKLKEPLDLGLEEVKVTSVSHEKAFYHYEKTRVVPWKISEKLFGVLVLAFIKDDQYGTDFCKIKRFKGILKKFASLINEYYKKEIKISKKLDWIVGKSPAINKVKETIVKVAKVDYPVLIRGESGSGKDLVARGVHQMSQRAAGPFVPVNAAAIPENLLEAELFGYKKGAFSGAAES
ncbi:MAG: sigma-54 factor interaction domain-containing protein, partial [bacterium]|nr:sigma-54 factor interaction domain-containing protein [bacterium]